MHLGMKIHRTSSQIFNVDIRLPILSLLSTVPVCHFAEAKKTRVYGEQSQEKHSKLKCTETEKRKTGKFLARRGKKCSNLQRQENERAINLTRRINCRPGDLIFWLAGSPSLFLALQ